MDAITTPLEFPKAFEWHRTDLFECMSTVELFADFREGHDEFTFGDLLGERNESEGILYDKVTHERPPFVQVDRCGLGCFDDMGELDKIGIVDRGMVGVQKGTQGFLCLICLVKEFQQLPSYIRRKSFGAKNEEVGDFGLDWVTTCRRDRKSEFTKILGAQD
jgi:hypothetical protein